MEMPSALNVLVASSSHWKFIVRLTTPSVVN